MCLLAGCKMFVSPAHEALRHQDGVQAVGETGYFTFKGFGLSAAVELYVHVYQSHQAFRQLGQIATLGKAEVIEIKVIARDDDRNKSVAFGKAPVFQVHVHVFVGYGFEEHFCGEPDIGLLHVEAGRYVEQRRGESANALGEVLLLQFCYFFLTESIVFSSQASQCVYLLGYDEVFLLHEAVAACEERNDVVIELQAQ